MPLCLALSRQGVGFGEVTLRRTGVLSKGEHCSQSLHATETGVKHLPYGPLGSVNLVDQRLYLLYGKTLSRLPGKVSDCDVELSKSTIEKLLTRQIFFPLSGKVVFIWAKHYPVYRELTEISPVNKRDLGRRENFFVSYERSVTFHIIFITRRDLACKLVEMFSR